MAPVTSPRPISQMDDRLDIWRVVGSCLNQKTSRLSKCVRWEEIVGESAPSKFREFGIDGSDASLIDGYESRVALEKERGRGI
jgi:hypothetical protein